jgi:CRISPR-associated protein Cas1
MSSNRPAGELVVPGLQVSRDGVLVVGGHGIRVSVERAHLVVSDAMAGRRRSFRLSRATSNLQRLVLLGSAGYVSLEAVRWLHDMGAALSVIDRDGSPLLSSGPRLVEHARLRRAQALAPFVDGGVRVARDLLEVKLRLQSRNLEGIDDPVKVQALHALHDMVSGLAGVRDLEGLRLLESAAADVYWSAWERLPFPFPRQLARPVPEHWMRMGPRKSPRGQIGAPNKAITPANALINFLYAVLETETSIACQAMSLDPGLGILHVDRNYRHSFVLDVMEPVRPSVDRDLLEMLKTRTFSSVDFLETRDGVCRVGNRLATVLAGSATRWRVLVAPVVERVAQQLIDLVAMPQHFGWTSGERLPMPLSQDRRRRSPARPPQIPPPPAYCRECGVRLDPERRWCDDCTPKLLEVATAASVEAAARRRTQGQDPMHGGEAAVRRARSAAHNLRQGRRWNAEHEGPPPDPSVFRDEILPGLQHVPLLAMMRATGLSKAYCGFIRKGRVPHPVHWQALRALLDDQKESI